MKYKKRIADKMLELKLESFGGVLIVGPKGCGKTTTAKQKANSIVEFQDEDNREEYISVANNKPSMLLVGKKPILFDEWQDAPKIWGAIRKKIDDEGVNGSYILTGSTSQIAITPHTGTQRISTLMMRPMSLYESGESNGEISLKELFDNEDSFKKCSSNISLEEIIFSICRGGWPRAINNKSLRSKLEVAKDLFIQICDRDISNVDNQKRNSKWVEAILKSYSRNICTLSKLETIYKDVLSNNNISRSSFDNYLEALDKLFIIDDIDAWCPSIRSKSSIRASKKRNFIDPSIAVAALGLSPEYFNKDFKTLGFLFESLCIRDLKIYSSSLNGKISYYRDRYGLESNAVLHLGNGKYALIEFKLGNDGIEEGAKHLLKIEKLIIKNNEDKNKIPINPPNLKIIITATKYGYKREDGVLVIPISCLRD